MSIEHTYVVTYTTADGVQRTEYVIGRNHRAVGRFIEKLGGTVVHVDRDDDKAAKSRAFRHDVMAVILFVAIALAAVAYWWHKL